VFARVLRGLADAAGPLVLVDVGAGDGSFAAGVIDALGTDPDAVVESLVLVERSRAVVSSQRENLRTTGIRWRHEDDVSSIEPTAGPTVVHASELYDALPVHRVEMGTNGLCEMWVATEDGRLDWSRRPARGELAEYFANHGVTLQPGQLAEVSLETGPVHRQLLDTVSGDGIVFVLDYGYPADRLYDDRGRIGGSISCYRGHELSRNPLEDPGRLDITAHVNWDDLRSTAVSAGWTEVSVWPLAEFLVRAGLEAEMLAMGVGEQAELTARTVTERQEIKRLLDPDGMGVDLKMLVQATGGMAGLVGEVLGAEHR
jgi:SAM-dependent MidA family methyltransferase